MACNHLDRLHQQFLPPESFVTLRENKKDELASRLEEALGGWHLVAFTTAPVSASALSPSAPSGTTMRVAAEDDDGEEDHGEDHDEAFALGGRMTATAGADVEQQILRQFAAAEEAACLVEAKYAVLGQLCQQYQEDVAALQQGISVSVPASQVREYYCHFYFSQRLCFTLIHVKALYILIRMTLFVGLVVLLTIAF